MSEFPTPPEAFEPKTQNIEGEKPYQFEIVTDPEQRELLAEATMELVNEVHELKPDTVVFLDKSARPIQTLFRELWHKRFPDKSVPNVNFVNIGREKLAGIDWVIENKINNTGPEEEPAFESFTDRFARQVRGLTEGDLAMALGMADKLQEKAQITDEAIRSASEIGYEEIAKMKKAYDYLKSSRSVMLVDEYVSTGSSIQIADAIICKIFPNIEKSSKVALTSMDFDPGISYMSGSAKLFKITTEDGLIDGPQWRSSRIGRPYNVSNVGEPITTSKLTVDRGDQLENAKQTVTSRIVNEKADSEKYGNPPTRKEFINKLEQQLVELNNMSELPNINDEMRAVANEYWEKNKKSFDK